MSEPDQPPPYWVLISVLFSSQPLTPALAMTLHQAAYELYARGDGVRDVAGDMLSGKVRNLRKELALGAISGPAFEAGNRDRARLRRGALRAHPAGLGADEAAARRAAPAQVPQLGRPGPGRPLPPCARKGAVPTFEARRTAEPARRHTAMDPKEYLNTPAGIPLDPAWQKDPEADGDRVPAEGRAEELNDITGQHGGQRTEVDLPWNGAPELQDEYRRKYDKSEKKDDAE